MKNIKFPLKNLFILAILVTTFIACDRDYISLGSDISGQNNFDVFDKEYEVIAFNNKLNPVQTNGLPSNLLGVYKDLVYGSSKASMVTQLTPTIFDPTFPDSTRMDSVVLTIPYFSKSLGIENEETKYKLDSIYGDGDINLKLYENNYFLRSFDPNSEFNAPQKYYSDRSLSASNQIPLSSLQGEVLHEFQGFKPNNSEIKLKQGEEVTRLAPAIRVKMDTTFWKNKILLKEGQPELSNANNFQNYFRGIYFETEANTTNGVMMLLNFGVANANITIHYSSPPTASGTERVSGTYQMNFPNNKVNFFENDFSLAIPNGDPMMGDEKLYLKGGEGSMAIVDLFDGTDVDDNDATMTAFEEFKNDFVETDADGKFVKAKRLINEANLIFYVDQSLTNGQEPDRIYIYDTKNQIPLIDFRFDAADKNVPNNSRISHLGKLEREGDDENSKGVRYKIKITEHIKNLLLKDSTNVRLGVSVSTNVNMEEERLQNSILTPGINTVESIPGSSVLSPKGTVLYGNNTTVPGKRLHLEILYTEPNNE
ncbi:DUF4270 domain-containing protein [Gelidibacter mesophilus]|uniref:DUF4270 domain-containing protein n=1 Tax=Gelidibacter mesophilus TaxID=169050 RepID=UPI000426BBAE|nr:DUF4270 domain-containing protein [Gelidibacter mesophilus]